MSNCTGHCCESFCTQFSPKEWSRYRSAIVRGKKTFSLESGKKMTVGSGANKRDIVYIAEMLIPIKSDKRRRNDNERGLNYRHIYTCKHFDTDTRKCTAYESRPKMCSGYPENTGHECKISGCTYYGKCKTPTE